MADDNKAGEGDRVTLSEARIKEIGAALTKKIPGGNSCNVCGSGRFRIAGNFIAPPILTTEGNYYLGAPVYPQIMLVCGNCGNTRYHNALVLGVYERPGDGG